MQWFGAASHLEEVASEGLWRSPTKNVTILVVTVPGKGSIPHCCRFFFDGFDPGKLQNYEQDSSVELSSIAVL